MSAQMLTAFFGWCVVLNAGVLACWFLFFLLAHDWMYRFHGRFAKLSVETFDSIHYAGMAFYKVGIVLLNLCPFLALLIVT